MALVPAKCTQCGADVEVDNTHDAAVCKYCGTAFIIEKAINKYNIESATIQNANINVNGSEAADEKAKAIMTLINTSNWDSAKQICESFSEQYPSDYRSYWYKVLVSTHNFTLKPYATYNSEIKMHSVSAFWNIVDEKLVSSAIALAPAEKKAEMQKAYDDYKVFWDNNWDAAKQQAKSNELADWGIIGQMFGIAGVLFLIIILFFSCAG